MIFENLNLNEFFPTLPYSDENLTLTVYAHENTDQIDENRIYPVMVILPGGGYEFTSDREAEPMALPFFNKGFNVFVLRYTCAPKRYPTQLLQVSAAIAYTRKNCKKYNNDTEKVAVIGFSAGGHLTATISCLWNQDFICDTLKINKGDNKPNAAVLSYPVISGGVHAHRGSFDNLLGDLKNDEKALFDMSMENRVSKDTPPSFIWHTFNDEAVPVENSLLYASALAEKKVPFELHIYPKGDHGLSLCDYRTAGPKDPNMINPYVATWIDEAIKWLKVTL